MGWIMEKSYNNSMTKHGEQRLRSRVSTSKRQLSLVKSRGKPYTNFVGSFRRYLDKVRFQNDTYPVIYGNYIYLFGFDNSLITVLLVPSKYNKYLKKSK